MKELAFIQIYFSCKYHGDCAETNEIGDIHLNTAFVCEETQPTPEEDVKTPPKSGTSAATSNDCASPQPGTSKREKEKRLGTVAEEILHQR